MRYDTPEALAKFDREFFEKGTNLYDAMADAKRLFLMAKEKQADAKKVYEAARIELEEHTGAGKKHRGQKPPGVQLTFDDIKPDPAKAANQHPGKPAGGVEVVKGDGWYPDDLWRLFPLDRLAIFGLSPSDAVKLREGKHKKGTTSTPLTTMGELADFTQPFKNDPTRNYTYTDIKGIGAEGATRIDKAHDRFWNEWREKGLAAEFARERGYRPKEKGADSANDAAKPATGSGASKGGGKGNKPGKPRTAGAGKGNRPKPGSGGNKTGKPKPAAKPAEPEQPGGDEHPATVPFEQQPAAEQPPEPTAEVS